MNYSITGSKGAQNYAAIVPTFAALQSKIKELLKDGYRGIGVRFVVLAS